jgi:hypothetical protein
MTLHVNELNSPEKSNIGRMIFILLFVYLFIYHCGTGFEPLAVLFFF